MTKSTKSASSRTPKVRQRKEQQRSIDTRRAMLDAALIEFATNGFDGASTRNIAKRAEVKQQLVIYHFGSKEGLWRAAALDVLAELVETWTSAIPEDSTMSALERVKIEYKNLLYFTVKHPHFHHFMLQENLPGSPRLKWLVENVLAGIFDRLLPQIKTAQAEGQMLQGDPVLVYYGIVGMVTALISLSAEARILTGIEAFTTETVERYWEIVENAFFK